GEHFLGGGLDEAGVHLVLVILHDGAHQATHLFGVGDALRGGDLLDEGLGAGYVELLGQEALAKFELELGLGLGRVTLFSHGDELLDRLLQELGIRRDRLLPEFVRLFDPGLGLELGEDLVLEHADHVARRLIPVDASLLQGGVDLGADEAHGWALYRVVDRPQARGATWGGACSGRRQGHSRVEARELSRRSPCAQAFGLARSLRARAYASRRACEWASSVSSSSSSSSRLRKSCR